MDRYSPIQKYLSVSILVILIAVFIGGCSCGSRNVTTVHRYTQEVSTYSSVQQVPSVPSGLTAEVLSSREVILTWDDNSDNEQGFEVYRDNTVVANLNANTGSYYDSWLSPATEYLYSVVAYNSAGKSAASSCYVQTANPSIVVRLDRIGVYDNRENFLRGNGDIYVLVVITDGVQSVQMRFPSDEGETYSLDKNESVAIGELLFTTREVGDYLSIAIVGYESDGGGFEQLAYQALGMALESGISGGIGTGLLEMYDLSLGGLLASFFGAEDDWLGSYECNWTRSGNWGSGSYIDLTCYDERGQACLRLWFTIICE